VSPIPSRVGPILLRRSTRAGLVVGPHVGRGSTAMSLGQWTSGSLAGVGGSATSAGEAGVT
jgi:hypothetical protein